MKRYASLLMVAVVVLSSAALRADGSRRYMGVFECGQGKHAFVSGYSWSQFVAQWQQKSGQGLRLVDFENYPTSAGRRYTGVFREGNDGHALIAGVKWPDLYSQWVHFNSIGLELVDAEVHGTGLYRTFDGVFREGTSPYNITQKKWDDFVMK